MVPRKKKEPAQTESEGQRDVDSVYEASEESATSTPESDATEQEDPTDDQSTVEGENNASDGGAPSDDKETPDAESEADSVPPRIDYRDERIRILEGRAQDAEAQLRDYIRAHKKAAQDTEGFKARLLRDQERAVAAAKAKVVTVFLDIADNMERTLEAVEKGGPTDALRDGIALVHRQIHQRMAELGLERYDPQGEPFDPQTMEALSIVPVTDPEDANRVMLTLSAGFRLGEQELRPARVQVGQLVS